MGEQIEVRAWFSLMWGPFLRGVSCLDAEMIFRPSLRLYLYTCPHIKELAARLMANTFLRLINFMVVCVWLRFSVCFPASAAPYCSSAACRTLYPSCNIHGCSSSKNKQLEVLRRRSTTESHCLRCAFPNTDVECEIVSQLTCAVAVITAFTFILPLFSAQVFHSSAASWSVLHNSPESVQQELSVPVSQSRPFFVLIMLADCEDFSAISYALYAFS